MIFFFAPVNMTVSLKKDYSLTSTDFWNFIIEFHDFLSLTVQLLDMGGCMLESGFFTIKW